MIHAQPLLNFVFPEDAIQHQETNAVISFNRRARKFRCERRKNDETGITIDTSRIISGTQKDKENTCETTQNRIRVLASKTAVLLDRTNADNNYEASPITQSSIVVNKEVFKPLDNTGNSAVNGYLFVYALCHVVEINNEATKYALLSGFMFNYLEVEQRSPSIFLYGNPPDMPATSASACGAILNTTKAEFIESEYQENAVLVVDEAIYASLLKEIEKNPVMYDQMFLLLGDWHFMKNLFGIVGKFISGSAVTGILGVYDVNRTFSAYTLLFITLFILQIEQFIHENKSEETVLRIIISQMNSTLVDTKSSVKVNKKRETIQDEFKQSVNLLDLMNS
ncbi:unnamed protein product [Didymodactylos carnosus]|uniref:Uncharacterized protein n=1 Tax=Didymodactylos carnosus TaxID=1234261 RepID=A0A8S2E0Y7_9BILA|nr:unnamed protein product [Didymodactylos carnosus]CAF3866396.1 unnamed protein product [Didymodactylos carnosus]